MDEILITGSIDSKEKKEEIKGFAKEKGLKITTLKNQEVLIVPSDPGQKEAFLENELNKMKKVEFNKVIEDFFDTYAIEFKKNKEELPAFFQIIMGSEYNDNGGSYASIEEIIFFDEKKKRVSYDFTVESLWDDEASVEYALDAELTENFDVDYIERLFDWNDYIKVPKGE